MPVAGKLSKGLTPKMAKFCELYLLLNSGYKAVLQAGYKAKDDQNAMVISSHLLSHPKVRNRLQELQAIDLSAQIMSVKERKERLSEIARAELVDFLDVEGRPTLTRDTPHHAAAMELVHRAQSTKDGGLIVTKAIKLRDPVTAISELNKMEHVYEAGVSPQDLLAGLGALVRLAREAQSGGDGEAIEAEFKVLPEGK